MKVFYAILLIAFIGVFILLKTGPLFAQAPPNIPSAADEAERMSREDPFESLKPKPEVEIEEEEKEVGPPPAEDEKKFFVSEIKVTGNTVVSAAEIKELTKRYENRDLSLSDLMRLANNITALYASKGYVTSEAYVPPQRIIDGTATIEIIEGEYGDFYIDGAEYSRTSIIAKRFQKPPYTIFNYNQLRKDLQYLNESKDRIVRAAMMAGELPRTTDFRISIEERLPVHVTYEWKNTGKKSTGLWRNTYKLEDTNLFGYDDNFAISYIGAENNNLKGFSTSYRLPINDIGSTFSTSLSRYVVDIGHDNADLDIESISTSYSFTAEHPVYESGNYSATADLALDVKEARIQARSAVGEPITRSSRDRLRYLSLGLTMEGTDEAGRSVVRNELSWQPANFLGSCDNIDHASDSSRDNADGTFIKYYYKITRLQRLPLSSILLFNLTGQATNNLLYSSEQLSVGGADTVRGYDEGRALGDYGANATSEVRFPLFFIPEDYYINIVNPRKAIQGVCFLDWAFVHQKSSTNSQTKRHNEKLLGTGVGLRFNIINSITGKIDVGWPIGNESLYGRDARVHMQVSVKEPTIEQFEQLLEDMIQHRIRTRLKLVSKDVPSDMIETFEKAAALEKAGDLEEAKELYVALINRKNEIMMTAKTEINEAIQKEIELSSYYEEAEALYKEGEYSKARRLYEKMLLLRD